MLIEVGAVAKTLKELIWERTTGAADLELIESARPYPSIGYYVVDFENADAEKVFYSTTPWIDATLTDSNWIVSGGRATFTVQNLSQISLVAANDTTLFGVNVNFLP